MAAHDTIELRSDNAAGVAPEILQAVTSAKRARIPLTFQVTSFKGSLLRCE